MPDEETKPVEENTTPPAEETPEEAPADEAAEAAAKAPPVNKVQMKKEAREFIDAFAINEGETPLFRANVVVQEVEGEMKAVVVLNNKEDEPAVQRLIEEVGDKFLLKSAEWTEESKRGKYDAKMANGGVSPKTVRGANAGKKIYMDPSVKNEAGEIVNPRKAESKGWYSFEVLKAFWKENGEDSGMPYEDYIKNEHGRSDHMSWDEAHGNVILKKDDSEPKADAGSEAGGESDEPSKEEEAA